MRVIDAVDQLVITSDWTPCAEPLGWLAPVFTAIVSYTFFGLDAIGDELEDPFGRDENDLSTDAMVRTIEREVLAALGATQLPPVLEPVDYVLR
ncbi:hypothetical protein PS903_02794 [Pseudomonas fluorescens]|nr:hypothetical protein PS903_02794 [Pseudomonas fluorescens]